MVSKAQIKFKELLADVDSADARILSLFPSLDYRRTGIELRTVTGLRTALRVLLVAVEEGYVNDQLLVKKYAVGGDSRRRVLPQLLDLQMLSRKEELSEKKVKRFRYLLADKGVLLSAAFQRIFKSSRYVDLVRDHVTNKSLAQVLMILYLQRRGDKKNALLETLHSLAEIGLNFEHVAEDELTNRILDAEQLITHDPRVSQLFELLEIFVNSLPHASQEQFVHFTEFAYQIPSYIEFARSEPVMTKRLLTLIREMMQFLASPDFQMYLMTHRDPSRLKDIVLDELRLQVSPIKDMPTDERLGTLWRRRIDIVENVSRRLREETYSQITRTYPEQMVKRSSG